MAEKTEKKPNVFVRAGKASAKFFRDTKGEIKKIVWPTPILRKTVLGVGQTIFLISPLMFCSFASRSLSFNSMSLERSIFIAISRFWICERSF